MDKELIVTQELGCSLPITDRHAVSVSLPAWDHVIGYEEGMKEVLMQLQSGYPRFRFHNSIQGLLHLVKAILLLTENQIESLSVDIGNNSSPFCCPLSVEDFSDDCLIFPTRAIAKRFENYMSHLNQSPGMGSYKVTIYALADIESYICIFPSVAYFKAKRYWQHSGEILSSRTAETIITTLLTHVNITSSPVHISPFELISNFPKYHLNTSILISLRSSANDVSNSICYPLDNPPVEFIFDRINESEKILKERIALIINHQDEKLIQPKDITLTTCGMASIFTALRVITQSYHEEHPMETCSIVVFGFPYLDTLKMMTRPEWNAGEIYFFGHGEDQDLIELEKLLEHNQRSLLSTAKEQVFRNNIAAVFTEYPTNPLMKACDVIRLSALTRKYGVVLVVDDTISNFANINLFNSSSGMKVDILCSSLTKIFSGGSNVMAGSLILNPVSEKYTLLSSIINTMNANDDLPPLHVLDAVVLEHNSRSFLLRSTIINKNAFKLARWLQNHPKIQKVNYVNLIGDNTVYQSLMRPKIPIDLITDDGDEEIRTSLLASIKSMEIRSTTGPAAVESKYYHEAGYGCLLSFQLHPSLSTKHFYDHLIVNKGPSLGTNFTLACPYTLLAHYCELEWAATFDVPAHLIRVSVGLEKIEDLIRIFGVALENASIPSEE